MRMETTIVYWGYIGYRVPGVIQGLGFRTLGIFCRLVEIQRG